MFAIARAVEPAFRYPGAVVYYVSFATLDFSPFACHLSQTIWLADELLLFSLALRWLWILCIFIPL